MSTLKVNTVQHNTSGFNNVVQFTDGAGTQNGTLCRAWVNFNGTGTVAIRADFNVNSITDNGTGDYTANFNSSLADANYSLVGSVVGNSVNTGQIVTGANSATSFTASSARFRNTYAPSNSINDTAAINIVVFR